MYFKNGASSERRGAGQKLLKFFMKVVYIARTVLFNTYFGHYLSYMEITLFILVLR